MGWPNPTYKSVPDVIRHAREECDCTGCGDPLLLGDRVRAPADKSEDWVERFCSDRCFQTWARWAFAPESLTYGG